MTTESDAFDTGLTSVVGYWSIPPARWSFSALAQAEECPRRWALEHASYPEVWAARGYPRLPAIATLFGNVVHSVLEGLVQDPWGAVSRDRRGEHILAALSRAGGWRALVLGAIDNELSKLDGNPRVSDALRARLREDLARRVPDAIDQVKVQLAALDDSPVPTLPPASGGAHSGTTGRRSRFVGVGTHPEVWLEADKMRLAGKIDLLTVDGDDIAIRDFKTGAPSPRHEDQLRLYALLWALDREANPDGVPATRLTIAYANSSHELPAPDETELVRLEQQVSARVRLADDAVRARPPVAKPTAEVCGRCPVRQMCAEYWAEIAPAQLAQAEGAWIDIECRIVDHTGIRTWTARPIDDDSRELLIRTPRADANLPVNARVRILGAMVRNDPDRPGLVAVSLSSSSEWFEVAGH